MPEAVCDGDAVSSPSAPEPHAEWELPAEPGTVGTIRSGVREFARAHGATDALLIDLALAVTEAVTNSVVHAFIDREPGIVRARIQAAPDELVVVVTDNGRGMQPRADSPGLGLGLPTIASLTTAMDMHAPPGGGTVRDDDVRRAGRRGPGRAARRARAELLDEVARIVEGTWPGEGVERLVDLLVPELADACALDVMDADGYPQRFAGRIDGPDGAAQSAWLAALEPRTDAPQSAARQAMDDGGLHVAELTPEHIARITTHRRGRRADGRDRHPLVDRGPARRRRPPARPAALRPAARPRRAARGAARASCAPSATAPRARSSPRS